MLRVVGGLERKANYLASASQGGGSSQYSFTGIDIGRAVSNRLLVAAVNNYDLSDTISGVTIAGVGASLVVRVGPNPYVEMWAAVCPNFTTGNVVVNLTGAGFGCSMGLWSIYGLSSPTARSSDGYRSGSTINLTVLDDAVVIAAASNGSASTGTISWTGTTKDFQVSEHSGSSASHVAAGVLGIGISGSSETAVAATWR